MLSKLLSSFRAYRFGNEPEIDAKSFLEKCDTVKKPANVC